MRTLWSRHFCLLCSEFLISAGTLTAADTAKVWTAADLKAMDQKLSAGKEKTGIQPLAAFSNYNLEVLHRRTSGEGEIHQKKSDIFYMLSGNATLITGGAIPGHHVSQPHEIRGAAVTGGVKRKIGPGDWITIPAGVPHQLLLDPGSEITYAVVKVEAK